MPYTKTGLMALYPIYLARPADGSLNAEEQEARIAQNECNLNQNLTSLYQKLVEIEDYLAEQNDSMIKED